MNYKDSKYFFKKSVRFRKWSRKAYAVFASICYQVSIGHVSKDIADSVLGINVSVQNYIHSVITLDYNPENLDYYITDRKTFSQKALFLFG